MTKWKVHVHVGGFYSKLGYCEGMVEEYGEEVWELGGKLLPPCPSRWNPDVYRYTHTPGHPSTAEEAWYMYIGQNMSCALGDIDIWAWWLFMA